MRGRPPAPRAGNGFVPYGRGTRLAGIEDGCIEIAQRARPARSRDRPLSTGSGAHRRGSGGAGRSAACDLRFVAKAPDVVSGDQSGWRENR